MRNLFARLWKDESGLTILEYGIAAAVIAVAVFAIMKIFARDLKALFTGAAAKQPYTGPGT